MTWGLFGILLLAGLCWHVFEHGIVHTLHRLIHVGLALALLGCVGVYYVTTYPERQIAEQVRSRRADAQNWDQFRTDIAWVWEQGHGQTYANRYAAMIDTPVIQWGLSRYALEHAPGYTGARHDWAGLKRVMRPIAERS